MDTTTYDTLNEERKDLIREIVSAVLAQAVPKLRSELSGDYVSRDEIQESWIGTITDTLNTRLDKIEEDGERRHGEFVKKYESRFELTATKEELSGVTKAGAENTERIGKLEASTEARLKLLEEDNKALKANDLQRAHEVTEIKASASKTADNAEKTSEAVIKLIGEFKAQKENVDREIAALKDSQKSDVKEIRDVKEDVFNNRTELNEIKSTVATEQTNARTNIQQIKDKIDGFSVSYRALDTKLTGYDTRLLTAESVMDKINSIASSVRWLFKDRWGNVLLAAMISSICGFQLLFAWLAYQFIQRMPN